MSTIELMRTTYFSTAHSRKLQQLNEPRLGAWLHVVAPSPEEIEDLAAEFDLEVDLLNDAIDPYESPRIERDGDTVYVFTRYCYPNANGNSTDPLLIIYRPDSLLTIQRSNTAMLERLTSGREAIITTQKTKTVLQILEEVNNSYRPYLNKATRQMLRIRSELKRTDISKEMLLNFIDLEDDFNEFLSALQPHAIMLRNLLKAKYLRLYEEDKDLVEDLSLGTAELIDLVNSRLKTIVNIREAYDAIAASELNRTFRKLTSISIFLTIPTITTGLYGMNLKLPLSRSPNAFWFVLLIVSSATGLTIILFRKLRWL